MTDNKEELKKKPRMPKVWEALAVLAFLVLALSVGIIKYSADPHIPLILGVMAAAVMALYLGYTWEQIEHFMIKGISKAMQSIIILVIIGILIGVWIDAGVVPAMIYYGLQILKPSIFFVAATLICSITSIATGTSWGTMGTMGVALMGIGYGLGMDPGMTAGAIISGAYFGDKMSPLSDTTNLAPAMSGTDIISHIRFMMLPTLIVYGISIIFYGILGFTQYQGGDANIEQVVHLENALKDMFRIHPLLLLPPIIVIVLVALKIPAIPGITMGIVTGAIIGLIFQPECSIGSLFDCGMNGFSCETGIAEVDTLLNSGGLMNMMFSVAMTIIAMMFGGIMDETHQLEVIVNQLKTLVRSAVGLVTLTEITCIISNIIMPEQYISIVVPGRMYAAEYKKKDLSATTLSNALESSGTITSALVPWNTCGVFIYSTLGISVAEYGIWAVFNWMMPIGCVLMAFMGITIADSKGVRFCQKKKRNMERVE